MVAGDLAVDDVKRRVDQVVAVQLAVGAVVGIAKHRQAAVERQVRRPRIGFLERHVIDTGAAVGDAGEVDPGLVDVGTCASTHQRREGCCRSDPRPTTRRRPSRWDADRSASRPQCDSARGHSRRRQPRLDAREVAHSAAAGRHELIGGCLRVGWVLGGEELLEQRVGGRLPGAGQARRHGQRDGKCDAHHSGGRIAQNSASTMAVAPQTFSPSMS